MTGQDVVVRKRSLTVAGHRTSISLEEPFWTALGRIAAIRDTSVQGLVAAVDAQRGRANLSSALRVFVLRDREAAVDAQRPP